MADFGFDLTRHNILQVNKSSYEQCINIDFISNVTRGGRDVFQLFQPKPYYFICGRGYCHQAWRSLLTSFLSRRHQLQPLSSLPPQPPLLSYPQTLLPLLLWPFSPSPLRLHTSTRSCFFSGPFLLHVTKYWNKRGHFHRRDCKRVWTLTRFVISYLLGFNWFYGRIFSNL